jgi:hypothetical protein
MTPVAELLGGKIHHLLQILLLIYLTGQLYLLILTIRLHRPKKLCFIMIVFFTLGWFILAILSDTYFWYEGEPFVMVREAERLPWGIYLVYEVLMMVYLLLAFLNCQKYLYSHLTDSSIKETIDLLPAGILIALPDGTVEMSNIQMNDLCEELTNRPLTNADHFWHEIIASGEAGQSHVLIRSEEDDDRLLFSKSPIIIEKQAFIQILATDVTERYQAIEEVQEKNRQLREYQNRMKNYQQLAVQTIRSEEILNARRIVHDQEGHALLTARYYLEHPDNVDPEALLLMLRQTNEFLLREAEDLEESDDDPVEEAASLAGMIGVKIVLSGDPPTDPKLRSLVGYAIRECAANTVKHGHGDLLFVSTERFPEGMKVRLENNGIAPTGPIRESGGLLSLRHMVEEMDGKMIVETKSSFTVELMLPGPG